MREENPNPNPNPRSHHLRGDSSAAASMVEEMGREEGEFLPSDGRSFMMDLNSPLAFNLRAAIAEKLSTLSDNYRDNDLVEYILVLVCSGKQQNQAKDDVEAFLGDDSGEFVTWLWNYVSEENYILRAALDSLKHKTVLKNYHATRVHSKCSSINASSTEVYERSDAQICGICRCSSVIDDTCSEFSKDFASITRYHPQGFCLSEHCPRYEKYQKIGGTNFSSSSCQSLFLPKEEAAARNIRWITSGPAGESLTLTRRSRKYAVSHHISRRRGNVWDRIGKPFIKHTPWMRGNKIGLKNRLAWIEPRANFNRRLMTKSGVPGSNYGKVISNNYNDGPEMWSNNVQPVVKIDDAHTPKWKRNLKHSGWERNHFQDPAEMHNMQQSLSINCFSSTDESQVNKDTPETIHSEKVIPASSFVPARSESLCSTRRENGNITSVNHEGLDMKLKIEVETSQLPRLCGLFSAGLEDCTKGKIKPRTVLVTNVHLAASRAAISSHFTDCGAILEVILLNDKETTQQKGAACIVFACKESVDKALLLSGTTFFSQILTVMQLADMPPRFLEVTNHTSLLS